MTTIYMRLMMKQAYPNGVLKLAILLFQNRLSIKRLKLTMSYLVPTINIYTVYSHKPENSFGNIKLRVV